jgi:hypothetical protein
MHAEASKRDVLIEPPPRIIYPQFYPEATSFKQKTLDTNQETNE